MAQNSIIQYRADARYPYYEGVSDRTVTRNDELKSWWLRSPRSGLGMLEPSPPSSGHDFLHTHLICNTQGQVS